MQFVHLTQLYRRRNTTSDLHYNLIIFMLNSTRSDIAKKQQHTFLIFGILALTNKAYMPAAYRCAMSASCCEQE